MEIHTRSIDFNSRSGISTFRQMRVTPLTIFGAKCKWKPLKQDKSTSRDFIARGRPLRGQKRFAPLAKRSTCSKSNVVVVLKFPNIKEKMKWILFLVVKTRHRANGLFWLTTNFLGMYCYFPVIRLVNFFQLARHASYSIRTVNLPRDFQHFVESGNVVFAASVAKCRGSWVWVWVNVVSKRKVFQKN